VLLLLIVYFIPVSSRNRFTFLLCESYGHNLKYVVTRNARTCVSNYPQTLMKLTLSLWQAIYSDAKSDLVGSFLKLNQSHEFDCTQAAYKRKFKSITNERYEGPNIVAAARINSKRTSSGQAFCCCTLAQSATRKGSLIHRTYVCKTMITHRLSIYPWWITIGERNIDGFYFYILVRDDVY